MPKPKAGESEKDFVARCIPIVLEDGTAEDQEQAAAVCYSMFKMEEAGFGAKKGEQIKGKLYRGEGGKFQSGPSDAELETIGLDRAMSDSLIMALDGKEMTAEQMKSLADKGYLTASGGLTLQAKTLANALKAKNINIAKALMDLQKPKASKASKAKGGGKAKKEKPTKEETQAANVEKIKSEIKDVDIDKLLDFESGSEIDSETAAAMVSLGLVDQGTEGEYRMTTAGKALLRAAKKGDSRAALDAVSRGKETVAKKAAAAKKREDAEKKKADAAAKKKKPKPELPGSTDEKNKAMTMEV